MNYNEEKNGTQTIPNRYPSEFRSFVYAVFFYGICAFRFTVPEPEADFVHPA